MSRQYVNDVADAFLAASLPIDPNRIEEAAQLAIDYYRSGARKKLRLPEEEVAGRFSEMWELWYEDSSTLSYELRKVVRIAICVDPNMEKLAEEYFTLEKGLEKSFYMSRTHAIALIGCAPLIRTLVIEQHLGLDRIRSILNVPGTNYDTIRRVLSAMGIRAAYDLDDIPSIHAADIEDVSKLYGDTPPDEAEKTFRTLLGKFSRDQALWENVNELVYVDFKPYLFMLYYEMLTLENTDRFPGRAIYECTARSKKVKALWNKMYHPTQQNPYLNNAKSVFSLDEAWAGTKLSPSTQNGSLMLADIFDIMAELPYTTRRRVAHVIRCYLVHVAAKRQAVTPLPDVTASEIQSFVETVCASNSLTKGVLDQRLVDFLTMCSHKHEDWAALGLGSSVNETNASGRKYGDVEYLDLNDRVRIQAYEAHGGGLRDEYIESHINSLSGTVEYHKGVAEEQGESYEREVEIVYVAHDVSRLSRYRNGYKEDIGGVSFTFRFITFFDLLEEAGGIEVVCGRDNLFTDLVHKRISRLPDAYSLKRRYQEIIGC